MVHLIERIIANLLSLTILVFFLVMGFYMYKQQNPSSNVVAEQLIEIEFNDLHPGDRIASRLKVCLSGTKSKLATYQLEDEAGTYFMVIHSSRDIIYPRCLDGHDMTPRIPEDIFDNGIVKPGKHRMYVFTEAFGESDMLFKTELFNITPKKI